MPEAFTIFMPAAGWTAELLTAAEELEYVPDAYQAQRRCRPGVTMCPATWAVVDDQLHRWPGGHRADVVLRVVLS